jgi:glycosyltransferase involved in cell wall biosynthesis
VGGIETLADVLASHWSEQGHVVEIITDVPAAPQRDPPREFAVHHRPHHYKILAIMRRSDLVLQQNISLKAIWPAAFTQAKFVASHHGWYRPPRGGDSQRERFKRWLARKLPANISCSHAVRDALGCGGVVIPNPYDDVKFVNHGAAREREIVVVGRLVSDKGVDVLINALRRMREHGVRPRATIVGDGPERRPLESLVAQCGLEQQVAFLGNLGHDELPRLLNAHQIMVVPSRWNEPFGIVALEGAACGCVVVGSSGGGLPEAIGPCGMTFPNGDDEALASILTILLAEPERLDGYRQAAPAHLAKHRADVVAGQYLDYFQSLVESDGGAAR